MVILYLTGVTKEHSRLHPKIIKNLPCCLPFGKPIALHLPAIHGIFDLRCQRFAVGYYNFTLDALDLQHPRLLQH